MSGPERFGNDDFDGPPEHLARTMPEQDLSRGIAEGDRTRAIDDQQGIFGSLGEPEHRGVGRLRPMVFQSVHHEAGEVREPVPVCFVEICMRLGIEHAE